MVPNIAILLFVNILCFLILGGYLPFGFFQWTNLSGKAKCRYISARCYTTNRLCRWFGGMNHKLLPLCAVLTGNDYGAPIHAETLLSLLDISAPGRGGGKGKSSACRIEGLLRWLSSFSSPAQALDEVSRLMGEGRNGGGRGKTGETGLSSQLRTGMQEYHITTQSSLARWFSGGRVVPGGQISGLPECLSQAAAQGLLAPFVVDAAVMHKVLLIPQVENSKLASSHCCATHIRQAVYGIVLRGQAIQTQEIISHGTRGGRGRGQRGRGGQTGRGRDQDMVLPTQHGGNVARGSTAPACVEEFDRLDLNLKKSQVEAQLPRTPLCLDTLDQVNTPTNKIYVLFVFNFFHLCS